MRLDGNMHFVLQFLLIIVVEAELVVSTKADKDLETAQRHRSKRIIWSQPLTDSQSPFGAPRWYAYISKGSWWSAFQLNLYRKHGWTWLGPTTASPANPHCGGVMLTPKAVGTACHCVSYVKMVNASFSKYIPKNGWENFMAVFNGYYTREEMEKHPLAGSWAWSKKFIVHEYCTWIHRFKYDEFGPTTHDFGLILLSSDITFTKPGTGTVPRYSMDDIAKTYYFIQQRESICLGVGYGPYYWEKRGITGPYSPVMMHGWFNVRNYWFCSKWYSITKGGLIRLGLRYSFVATALCVTFFGKIRSQHMIGDSGSPLTCDNIYIGPVSEGELVDRIGAPKRGPNDRSVTWISSIVFAMEWHAVDFSKNFDEALEEYGKPPARDDLKGKHYNKKRMAERRVITKNCSSALCICICMFATNILTLHFLI